MHLDGSFPPVLALRPQRLLYRRYLQSIDPYCLYCGRHLKSKGATLDHLVPISRGGDHHQRNLVLACRLCNGAKCERTPQEWLADLVRACQRLESGVFHGAR